MSDHSPTSGRTDQLRPGDLAALLAAGERLPRQRARDQQADRAGLELKRRVLELLAAIDPEPAELDGALAAIIDEIGPPTGPTRAIALTIRDDWHAACAVRASVAYFLNQAAHSDERSDRHHEKE